MDRSLVVLHIGGMRLATSVLAGDLSRRGVREFGLGFLYWLGFVLILEPGNLLRWAPADPTAWTGEVLRLVGAGLLGAAATPFILGLTRRLPIRRPEVAPRLAVHAAFCFATAVLLVVVSCVLASALPNGPTRALPEQIADQLAANTLLVAAWIAGLTALAHAALPGPLAEGPVGRSQIEVVEHGRLMRLDLGSIDWIETQGNYLALHGRDRTTLVRQTATSLEAELDPRRFVRIHRRAIVAVDAVQAIAPLGGGDATVRLTSGQVLRVSRARRAQLWKALQGL